MSGSQRNRRRIKIHMSSRQTSQSVASNVKSAFVGAFKIWDRDKLLPKSNLDELEVFLQLERDAANHIGLFIKIIKIFIDHDEVVNIEKLIDAAMTDLRAGCGLARLGYMKQAYTLWRSWFEQIIFALYFVEAPIHQIAWKVAESVSLDDSPSYRLMLHQILSEGSEKHPFALVYGNRYTNLLDSVKCSRPPREQQLLKKGNRVLTLLSQGVHGTYRPSPPKNDDELLRQISSHCTPALSAAFITVTEFWLCYLVNLIAFPEDVLVALRTGALTREQVHLAFSVSSGSENDPDALTEEDAEFIFALNAPFKTVFDKLK